MSEAELYFVFDIESVGLHGDGFAVGYCVVARDGRLRDHGRAWCNPDHCAQGTVGDRAWIKEHVPTFASFGEVPSARDLRAWFWRAWVAWRAQGARLAADVAWPVEARFLLDCIADDPTKRAAAGPYPLIDIASVRLAVGLDPLATVERQPHELPPHDPLADASQSARLLLEALNAHTTN